MRAKWKRIVQDNFSRRWGIAGAGIYFLVYLYSIGVFQSGREGLWSVQMAPSGMDKFFRTSAPFIWEPIFRIGTPIGTLVLAPMNVLLGVLLAVLVWGNLVVVIFLYRQPKTCRIGRKPKGLWAIFPSFLSGFACCAPTFLIPLVSLSASVTVYVLWLRVMLIPVSVVLLGVGLIYSVKQA